MRILLLGADGQVGFELHRALAPLGTVMAATRKGTLPGGAGCLSVNLADPRSLAALIRVVGPQWIVNAAAYTAVDRAEDDYDAALAANGESLGVIGAEAVRHNARVLHFSTDYVFAGNGSKPYREDDPTGPINSYGRSKLAGEDALRASGARHVVLRTAWVYGARGSNFLRTMLRLARTRERLAVVADQHGAPTTARLIAQVAALTLRAVGNTTAGTRGAFEGVYHVAASGETTWHRFATEIVMQGARAGLLPREIPVDPIASPDFPTRARRPTYSVLDCAKLSRALGIALPDWREGLTATIAELSEAAAQAGA